MTRTKKICATCINFETVMGKCLCSHPDHCTYVAPTYVCPDYENDKEEVDEE